MSVLLCIPSKRPPEEAEKVLKVWREQGYKVFIQRDPALPTLPVNFRCGIGYTLIVERPYAGYAEAVNFLAKEALATDPSCDWIVAAGDDTLPEPNKSANEIARECSEYFARRNERKFDFNPHTFGVMQPTGDRDFGDAQGPYIDRVAGSPWLGREFCLRINQGKGPLWPGYFHMGVDEELQAVAIKYGVFWQRPDLTHFHQHWGRPRPGERMGQASRRPAFLDRANSAKEWIAYKKLLKERQEAGFPGSEPL